MMLGQAAGILVVAEASNGEDALEAFRLHRPDVILVDVRMPNMDGPTLTRALLELDPVAKVIGLSMHNEPSIEEAMIEAGAKCYVQKSAPPACLLQCIRDLAR
jgi:DNA-binding NarL/FixJ family response regulator